MVKPTKGPSRDLEQAVSGPMPVRVQLSRAKGWRMPPNTVKVDRSTKWGNPFIVEPETGRTWEPATGEWLKTWRTRGLWSRVYNPSLCFPDYRTGLSREEAASHAVARFCEVVEAHLDVASLRGKNLACWCKLCPDHRAGKPFGLHCEACAPCHADVTGELANADSAGPQDEGGIA